MEKTCPRHPKRKLRRKNYKASYECSGCKMQGFGKRHACSQCDYVLHDDCMLPATSPIPDPLFGYFTFKFLHQPAESPGCSGRQRCCVACGKPIYGFNYHCREKDWDLHPCCSKLKDQLREGGIEFQLRDRVSSTCRWCNKRQLWDSVSGIPGWSYVSRCGKYHFHVYCMSDMVLESCRRGSEAVGDPRGGDGYHDYPLEIERIDPPSVMSSRRRGGRSGNKYWRMVRIFLKAIVGILVGDPTVIIGSILAELILQ